MFRTKICGITRPDDAQRAVEAGAEAIGLNFYRGSPRYVDLSRAGEILAAVAGRMLAVGVFVDLTPAEISRVTRELSLDVVQLSGHHAADWVAELRRTLPAETAIMQTLRPAAEQLGELRAHLDECRRLGCLPELVLFDAPDRSQFGGTGRVVDWQLSAACIAGGEFPPVVLAGGLRAENVAEAIRAVRPQGVDTASGVESQPGVKDAEKMRSFLAAARGAFDNLSTLD